MQSMMRVMVCLCMGIVCSAFFPVDSWTAEKKTLTYVEQLEQDMKKGLEYKRIIIVEKLAQVASPDAYAILIRTMLHDRSKPVRRSAQRMLEGVDDPRIVQSILEALNDSKRKVRLAAVDVAGLVRTPEIAFPLLATAKRDIKDTETVRLVMEALRELAYRMELPLQFENALIPFLKHRDRKVRETTVIVLAILGRPRPLPELIQLWKKANTRLKIDLADAFANIGWKDPVDVLQLGLKSGNTNLVLHCIYALAQIQSFATLPQLYTLMKENKNVRIRMACLYAFIEIPSRDSIPVILDTFDTQDPTTLHWATYALSQLQVKSAGPRLLEKLNHPANLVRASAATALGELKTIEAEPALLKLISDPQEKAEVQIAAARALIKLGNLKGVQVIWQELHRPNLDFEARLAYAMALGKYCDSKMLEEISKDLQSSNFTKSFTAALILGIRGDQRGRPTLISALDHGYPQIRRYAILGLERILDDESYRALASTANDDRDPIVRILCSASLVRAGFTDFRVILWNALETREEDNRAEAVIALGTSANEEIIRQLKWYLKREPSIPVKQTIQRVLREWKNRDGQE